MLGIGILPGIALGTGSLLLGREVLNMDTMMLATDAASVGLAKIKSTGSDAFVTNTTALAWTQENARILKDSMDLQTVGLTLQDSSIIVSTTYKSKPKLAGDIARIFERNESTVQQAKSEFFASPIEIVFTIDQSAMSEGGQEVAAGMSKVLDKLFEGKESDDMLKVSVVAVGTHVNLGTKYEALVSKASRRLQGPDDPYFGGDEAAYEKRKTVLEEINPSLVDDLLQPGGPGYNEGLMMVARPHISSQGEVADYVAKLDYPPEAESDKFVLLVNDGRVVEEDWKQEYKVDSLYTGIFTETQGMTTWPVTFKTYDGKDVISAPDDFWEDENNASLRMGGFVGNDDTTWAGLDKMAAGDLRQGVVNYPMCGPVMPILANSSSVSEIMEHVQQSMLGETGSVDEHFTWAYRLLAPGWSSVWSSDGSYPAPVTSSTVKHAWINVGRDTGGGYTNGVVGGDIDILPALLRKFAENRIVLHFLLDDADENIQQEIEDATNQYGKALGWEIIDLMKENGDLYEVLTEHLERPANFIRLAPVAANN